MTSKTEIVRAFLDSMSSSNMRSIASTYTEDAKLVHPSYADPGLNEQLVVAGRENIYNALQGWADQFKVLEVKIYEIFEKENKAMAYWFCHRQDRKTEEHLKAELMSYIVFSDDLIQYYRVFFDNV